MKVEELTDAQGVFVVLTYEGEEYYHSIDIVRSSSRQDQFTGQDHLPRLTLFTTL